jgi:hypothetical protein
LLAFAPLLLAFAVHVTYAIAHDQDIKNGDFPNWDVALFGASLLFAFLAALTFRHRDRRRRSA